MNDFERTAIPSSTHPAVRNAIDNGRLASSTAMTDLILVLKRADEQQAALDSFNAQQYDPSSPEYHHWMTPADFGTSYGVAESDLEAIREWLQSRGFVIDEIPPSHTSIRFSGSVEQVEAAFQTEMHSLTVGGVAHIANVGNISIPTALVPVVAGVKALHDFFPKPAHHPLSQLTQSASAAEKPAAARMPGSLASAGVGSAPLARMHPGYAPGDGYQLLVPYDMATIYNYKSLWSAA